MAIQPWSGATNYNIAVGEDPLWDAYLAQYNYEKTKINEDSGLGRTQANTAYTNALQQIADEAVSGRRSIDTNALARGIFQSGEVDRRRGDMDTKISTAKTGADTTYSDTLNGLISNQTNALSGLDLTREQQIAASRQRIQDRKTKLDEAAANSAVTNAATASTGATYAPPPPAFATRLTTRSQPRVAPRSLASPIRRLRSRTRTHRPRRKTRRTSDVVRT
jgi:hypothetical protein